MVKIAVVQFSTKGHANENLHEAEQFIQQAANKEVDFIIFPEEFMTLGMTPQEKLAMAEPYQTGRLQKQFSQWAKQYNLWIIGGTLPIQSNDPNKYYSSCIVWDKQGNTATRYDKIHLFDVHVGESETYCESSFVEGGKQIQILQTPDIKIGLAICYDIRFPELFRHFALQEVDLIVLPSAFTQETGKVHWETLLRARAIENLCYVAAPNQVGKRLSGHGTYGHSMIISPWGEILAQAQEQPALLVMDLDLENMRHIRERFPALTHIRPFVIKQLAEKVKEQV